MLNYNEKEILKVMQNKEYLELLDVNVDDIEKAVRIGIKEFKEIQETVNGAFSDKEDFYDLCKRLNWHNETFNQKYPDYNYFDLNYKSLLITIKEKLDQNNKPIEFNTSKLDVYIYPDNISKVSTDEICILDLKEEIDFEKVYKNLEKNIEEENSI